MLNAQNIQPILGAQGIPVLAGQMPVTDYESGGLAYIKQQMGIDPGQYGMVIAGAPYFGANMSDSSSLDSLFQGRSYWWGMGSIRAWRSIGT